MFDFVKSDLIQIIEQFDSHFNYWEYHVHNYVVVVIFRCHKFYFCLFKCFGFAKHFSILKETRLFQNLPPTVQQDAIFAADKLAASVIKTCAQEDELNPLVCGFLTTCIHDRDAMGSELKEYYYEIFSKVFQCAPQMLLAVIPSLTKGLSVHYFMSHCL